jgi:periplasmic protein CpxP/Spy
MNFRLIVITLAASALFAQGPGGPRMHRMSPQAKTTEVQSYLNLTDAQISTLQQLRQSEMAALKPIFQQIGPMRQSLRSQAQSSSADATAVGKLVLSIQSLEQQAAPIRSSFQQQALNVLTADQKTKLAALQSAAALMPTIHEATALNLLTPPKGSEGPGGFGAEMPRGRFGGPR